MPEAATPTPASSGSSASPTALAPQHLRLFALLFDYALIVAGVKLVEQVLLGEHWDLRQMPAASGWQTFVTPWQGVMLVLLLARDAGGTGIGKWLTGLVVRRADDPARKAGLGARLLRNVSLAVFPVDAWLVFSDPFGRRLGDRLAGTVVVQNPKPPDLFQRAMGLGALFLGLILGALLVTSWNLHRSAAYQTAYAAATQDAGLARQVGSKLEVEKSPELELRLPGLPGYRDFGPLAPSGSTVPSGATTPNGAAPPGGVAAPGVTPTDARGTAIAIFDAKGSAGKAKLRVEMALLPATAAELARWQVTRTEVLDALGGPLKQVDAPKK